MCGFESRPWYHFFYFLYIPLFYTIFQLEKCSCRHSFCYYAGLYGIPLSIVQSIVGHMTPEMTKHYSAHASLSAKREQMRQLPEFMMLSSNETRDFEAADREELQALISTLPIEKVRQLLEELR